MRSLALLFFDICIFRSGPQAVPSSSALMRLLVLLYVAAGVMLSLLEFDVVTSIARTALDTAIMIGMVVAVLRWFKHSARIEQTVSALTGTGVLMSMIALPMMSWLYRASAANQDLTVPAFLWLVLLLWSLAVIANIMRHAISANLSSGILFAVVYVVFSLNLTNLLFPPVT